VGVDGDDLVAGAHPADHVAEAVEADVLVAELRQLLGDALDDALLLTGLRGNRDHVAQEFDHIGLVGFGCFLDCFVIHTGNLLIILRRCVSPRRARPLSASIIAQPLQMSNKIFVNLKYFLKSH
jgi:hypothetical protein